MNPSCPISAKRVDTNRVRLIAMQVSLVSIVLLLSGERFFALLLLLDFTLRVLRKYEFSPFNQMASFIIGFWGMTPKYANELPKRFALILGLSIALLLLIFYFFELSFVAPLLALILFICSLMEALFDYCIGCKIYHILQYLLELADRDKTDAYTKEQI
jgi:CBS domain containing-hemolysin-like protein